MQRYDGLPKILDIQIMYNDSCLTCTLETRLRYAGQNLQLIVNFLAVLFLRETSASYLNSLTL